MAVPVLTFFNNKGGAGKTSLVYHLAWMLSEIGYKVLACDLDPQANLSSAFLDEDRLETLWDDCGSNINSTIFRCVAPLLGVGDLLAPSLQEITPTLKLIPGDLALSGFEDSLSSQWAESMGSDNLYRAFRILAAFWTNMQRGADAMGASIILADLRQLEHTR